MLAVHPLSSRTILLVERPTMPENLRKVCVKNMEIETTAHHFPFTFDKAVSIPLRHLRKDYEHPGDEEKGKERRRGKGRGKEGRRRERRKERRRKEEEREGREGRKGKKEGKGREGRERREKVGLFLVCQLLG